MLIDKRIDTNNVSLDYGKDLNTKTKKDDDKNTSIWDAVENKDVKKEKNDLFDSDSITIISGQKKEDDIDNDGAEDTTEDINDDADKVTISDKPEKKEEDVDNDDTEDAAEEINDNDDKDKATISDKPENDSDDAANNDDKKDPKNTNETTPAEDPQGDKLKQDVKKKAKEDFEQVKNNVSKKLNGQVKQEVVEAKIEENDPSLNNIVTQAVDQEKTHQGNGSFIKSTTEITNDGIRVHLESHATLEGINNGSKVIERIKDEEIINVDVDQEFLKQKVWSSIAGLDLMKALKSIMPGEKGSLQSSSDVRIDKDSQGNADVHFSKFGVDIHQKFYKDEINAPKKLNFLG